MLGALFSAVQDGLLGYPDMQVLGNHSSNNTLKWYSDRASAELPGVWTITVPLLVWRGLMLLWALWLAVSLIAWLKWAWQALCYGGLWQRKRKITTPV